MEREERERHDVENRRRAQYEKDYDHPEGPVRNPARQPRSEVVAVVQDDDAAQVSDSGDDVAITAFPAWAPRLRSVAYPTTSSPTSRSTTVAPTPTSSCRPTTSRSRRQVATSTTWRPTSRW
jgi:hypothetical protein